MVTHSSILAWEIPWTEEPGGLRGGVHGVQRVSRDLATKQENSHYLSMFNKLPQNLEA